MVETVKNTDGPWITRWDEEGGAFVTGGGTVIANMVGPAQNRKANARLIAAAPDLLDALKGMLDITVGDIYSLDPAVNAARKAIAKSEGRS